MNLTKQKISLILAQAIAELSLEINTSRASINSSSCSFEFESLLTSYSYFLIPIKHHASRTPASQFLHTNRPVMLPPLQVHSSSRQSIFGGPPSKRFLTVFQPDFICLRGHHRAVFFPTQIRFLRQLLQILLQCPVAEFLALSIST